MASRNPVSATRRTPGYSSVSLTSARPSTVPIDELPPHKKPSHPLNQKAKDQLRTLNSRPISQLKNHHTDATRRIAEVAGLVNDKLREREEDLEKQRKRWEKGIDTDEQEEEEQRFSALREKVEEVTRQLEESMRAVIDGVVSAQRIEEALEWLRQNAPGQLENEYETQMSQRQTQTQRRHTQDLDGEEMEGEEDVQSEGPTPGPTPLDGSRLVLSGINDIFADRMTRKKNEYTSISLTDRYSKNDAYISFKGIVHDARYQDNGTLSKPETWFTENGSPAPGTMQPGADDSDDDIQLDKERISTRCPLTFQKFKEPLSSKKCPHTFEKNAILDMIRKSNTRLGGGRNGERAVECPISGCSQLLTASDLHHDAVKVRKIKRLLRIEAQEVEGEEGESEDDIQ